MALQGVQARVDIVEMSFHRRGFPALLGVPDVAGFGERARKG
jgi:hypothetical protein